jgi:hypothetical protein
MAKRHDKVNFLKNRKPFIDAIIEDLAMFWHTRRVAFVCTGGE